MVSKYFVLCISIVAGIVACKKATILPLPVAESTDMANVKIVHASAYGANPPLQIKVNDIRVSSAITYATPFPGGGLNTGGLSFPYYLALNPGNLKISTSIPKFRTNIDSIALFSGNFPFEANKYYTVYLSDTLANTQATIVTENKALPATGTSRYKFVNLIPNLSALDLYAGTNKVASNVPYKGVSPDFTLNTNDTVRFYIRPAGAPPASTQTAIFPALSPFAAAYTVPQQRIMTVFARGYNGVTGTRAPQVSLTFN